MIVYVCVYSTGKAARDMMFLTMALEQPHILVLNYAPGPVDTEMQVEARTKTGDPELRTMFQSKRTVFVDCWGKRILLIIDDDDDDDE